MYLHLEKRNTQRFDRRTKVLPRCKCKKPGEPYHIRKGIERRQIDNDS